MSRADEIFLGIDGGGTRCRALLCTADGNSLGDGFAGPANIVSDFVGARANVLEATQQALEQAGFDNQSLGEIPAFLGLAGANIGDFATKFTEALPFENCIVETDALIALEGAVGSEDGLAVIIGTGSVAICRNAGKIRTTGGWGFMVGDFASGAWLGRHLLQEVLLSYDGIREGSPFTQKVLGKFENNPQTVVEYAHTARPGEFGKFAPLIFEYANKRDPIACQIVRQAISDIEETLDKLLPNDGSMFCMLGGLGHAYSGLLSDCYQDRVQKPKDDAVTGAAKLAIQHFAKMDA